MHLKLGHFKTVLALIQSKWAGVRSDRALFEYDSFDAVYPNCTRVSCCAFHSSGMRGCTAHLQRQIS